MLTIREFIGPTDQRILNERICRACGIDKPGLYDADTLERIESEADLKENNERCEEK